MEQPSPRRVGRPATGQTQVRTVRVGTLWDRVEALAGDLTGETMTDVVKRLLAAEERRLRRAAEKRQEGAQA